MPLLKNNLMAEALLRRIHADTQRLQRGAGAARTELLGAGAATAGPMRNLAASKLRRSLAALEAVRALADEVRGSGSESRAWQTRIARGSRISTMDSNS